MAENNSFCSTLISYHLLPAKATTPTKTPVRYIYLCSHFLLSFGIIMKGANQARVGGLRISFGSLDRKQCFKDWNLTFRIAYLHAYEGSLGASWPSCPPIGDGCCCSLWAHIFLVPSWCLFKGSIFRTCCVESSSLSDSSVHPSQDSRRRDVLCCSGVGCHRYWGLAF